MIIENEKCYIKQRDSIVISAAEEKDFRQIQEIYTHYVLNATATFEESPPSHAEMLARWKISTEKSLPYVVARNGEEIMGYAYAFPYRPRSAYRFTIEESVYVAKSHHGRGVGRNLLGEIIKQCDRDGYRQMLAVIAGTDNAASIKLHESLGFIQSGLLKNVGFKFGKWLDTIIMQKVL